MDSLSQIVLGAAVGEAVLGKKIGNRALAIGALGGTIPDLDVIANPFLTAIEALEFHRGISHSLLFAVIAPFFLAAISHFFFKKEIHNNVKYRIAISLPPLFLLLFLSFLAAYAAYSVAVYWGVLLSLTILISFGSAIFRYIKKTPQTIDTPAYKEWYWFFFWTLSTHILLDVFTTYGTQIFMPFTNTRVSFSSISVVDPIYTVPFCLFVLLLSFMRRKSIARRWTNYLALGLSSFYLVWTLYNKSVMHEIVKNSLAEQEIAYQRFMTTPTIFNNILWSTTVETDSSFLIGTYSRYDPEPKIVKFKEYPKNPFFNNQHKDDEHLVTLKRFADNYYLIQADQDTSTITFITLKWGTLSNLIQNIAKEDNFPATSTLQLVNGKYELVEETTSKEESLFENLTKLPQIIMDTQKKYPNFQKDFWDRITGKWQ